MADRLVDLFEISPISSAMQGAQSGFPTLAWQVLEEGPGTGPFSVHTTLATAITGAICAISRAPRGSEMGYTSG